MAELKLQNLQKIYPNNVQAVFDFNLDVNHGEFIVLVGPSGCGKSTTLRMVAGLEDITQGTLIIDGKDVTRMPPKNRDIAMVFQNYALYGHMTVYENMAFSLVLAKQSKNVIHQKVLAAAEILNLEDQLNKKPRQLSGGQRQRVAMGRAIVRAPKVFLFDEPLSNLDAKLRGAMRREIMLLHKRLGATMIYVTHDQIEALTLADRIVCMSMGYVQQIGTPLELYDHPANLFVATFIGLPPMNIMEVTYEKGHIKNDYLDVKLDKKNVARLSGYEGKEIYFGIRPEDIIEGDDAKMTVFNNENLGLNTLVHGHLKEKRVVCKFKGWCNYKADQTVGISFKQEKMHFFDKETTNSIREEI